MPDSRRSPSSIPPLYQFTRPSDEERADDGELLTMREFAAACGCTLWHLKNRLWQGKFEPTLRGGGFRGSKHLFAPEKVALYKQLMLEEKRHTRRHVVKREKEARLLIIGGKTTLQAIAASTELPFKTIERLYSEWCQLDRGIYIGGDTLHKIDALPLRGPLPIRTADDLLAVLTLASDEGDCKSCGKKGQTYCSRCFKKAARTAKTAQAILDGFKPLSSDEPTEASSPTTSSPSSPD